ncbi:MAG: hypothetical protein OEW37_10815 [Rhodospirillaceae bacterium]|nr:hypothetical protein [Rhodospirillaceae bacterium]
MQLHKDPTLEAASALEIAQKGCAVCARRRQLSSGKLLCAIGKKFPFCRGGNGFKLDTGGKDAKP